MTNSLIINTLIYVAPCFILLLLTFRDTLKVPALIKMVAAIVTFLAISFYGSGTYDQYKEYPIKFVIIGLCVMILGAIIFNLITEYHFRHSIFIVAIAKGYSDHVTFLAMYIYFLVHGQLPAYTTFDSSPYSLVILIVTFPLIYYFFKRILRRALDCSYHFGIWHMMWIIPMCNTTLYSLLFSPYISNYTVTPDSSFYYAPPFWSMLTFVTYIIILWMPITASENAKLSEKLRLSETILLSQQKQAETMQAQIEQTSLMRHDMRHHLVVMESYVKNKDLGALNEYIQECHTSLPESPEIYCDRLAVNSLIGYYKEMASQNETKFNIYVSLTESSAFSDMDLCSVLANLLENAVEACTRMKSKNRFIDLKISSQSQSVLAILVENSYEGEIRRSGDVFISSKKKNRKGIGISSVKNIVEQYNGVAKFEYQDNVFKASVLMNKQC